MLVQEISFPRKGTHVYLQLPQGDSERMPHVPTTACSLCLHITNHFIAALFLLRVIFKGVIRPQT